MAFYRVQVKVDEVAVVEAADDNEAMKKLVDLMAHPECEWFNVVLDELEDTE